jgi:rubrerythrin
MTMQDILMKAIETEKMGYRFYTEQAAASQIPLAKTLLLELASDEERHAEWFEQVLDQLNGGEAPVIYPDSAPPDIEGRMKAFFQAEAPSPQSGGSKSQEDAIKMAIALEKESYGVYYGLFQKASSEQEKRFFDRLRREEFNHLVALENILLYLTKTGMWFDIEETKRWNWMV